MRDLLDTNCIINKTISIISQKQISMSAQRSERYKSSQTGRPNSPIRGSCFYYQQKGHIMKKYIKRRNYSPNRSKPPTPYFLNNSGSRMQNSRQLCQMIPANHQLNFVKTVQQISMYQFSIWINLIEKPYNACFRSSTNSTGKSIVDLLVEFCSLLRCIHQSSLGPIGVDGKK